MDAVLRERVKGLISQKKFEKETPKKSRVVKGIISNQNAHGPKGSGR